MKYLFKCRGLLRGATIGMILILNALSSFASDMVVAGTMESLEQASDQILTEGHNVDESQLARDRAVISYSIEEISDDFQRKGFDDADLNSAVTAAWKEIRVERGYSGSFTSKEFNMFVKRLGKVEIASEPSDAIIDIDNRRQDEKTPAIKWIPAGRYRIRLSKEGFMPDVSDYQVIEGKNPPLVKTLRPKDY